MSDTAVICPYCRCPIEADEPAVNCEACATPHHADCYAENGGCTVFGCAKAPVDEPKVSISSDDLSQARPVTATPPPPRRPGSTTSVPPPPRVGGAAYNPQWQPQPMSFGGYGGVAVPATPYVPYVPRHSRMTYILLGVFLGMFGVHNFYAGYTKRAVWQLVMTLLSCTLLAVVAWIWAIVEVCAVKQDGNQLDFV